VREHPETVPGRYVRIAVSDTGTGMPPEIMAHLFEPFFTTKEKGKGTGLGLSMVYGIVKQSGGHINCYSEPGRGTMFTIYLPMTRDRPDEVPSAAAEITASSGKETVLVVEDDAAVRGFTRDVLRREGYAVIEACGGEEALKTASAADFEVALLVTDVVMPRMGGRELARALSATHPQMKVLYVSGYTANAIVHHQILDAGLDFLQKPFGSRELLVKVREILDRGQEPPGPA
jgi:two-component system cell cycle sensor histidine kinase/response regulator CckA